MKLLITILSFVVIGCGVQKSSALNTAGNSIVDNVNMFGMVDITPSLDYQKETLLGITKIATAAGLVYIAQQLGESHKISVLRVGLEKAENMQAYAKSMMTRDEYNTKMANLNRLRESIYEMQYKPARNALDAAIANGESPVKIHRLESSVITYNTDMHSATSKQSALTKVWERQLADGIDTLDEVTHYRKTLATSVNKLRTDIYNEIGKSKFGHYTSGIRKVAVVGGILCFVDAAAHVYVLHGLNIEPGIFASGDLLTMLGDKAYAWATGKYDTYTASDTTDYFELVK